LPGFQCRLAFMTAKRKSRKHTKSSATRGKRRLAKRVQAKKASSKKSAKKKATKPRANKKLATSKPKSRKKSERLSTKGQPIESGYPALRQLERPSGRQSGDLQGLSDLERADSESVDELLEEGNTFEAGIVRGVEEADDADEREVHTRELPEDDVPEEYLEKE